MTTRNVRDRIRRFANLPEETSPAEELAERREVAPAGEVSGPILAHHLEMPEEMGPEWSPILLEMREELGEAVQTVVRELIAEGRPEPLVSFGQATAAAGVPTDVRFAPVPLATVWEITNVFALHQEAGDESIELHLEPGGQIDAITAATAVGGSPDWPGPLYVRESVRLMVRAAAGALTAGNRLEVAIFGRIHSTRSDQ